jgi:hypothetical protein
MLWSALLFINWGDVGCERITVLSEIIEIFVFLSPLDNIYVVLSDSRTGKMEVGFLMRDTRFA